MEMVKMNKQDKLSDNVNQIYLSSIRRHYQEATDDELTKEMNIRKEITRRKFTKRQLNILYIIYELSYPYRKEKALIPRLQDFELCGVSKTKIREELDKLVELNVIGEETSFGLYWINNPREWNVKRHKSHTAKRSEELVILNLRDGNANVEDIIRNNSN